MTMEQSEAYNVGFAAGMNGLEKDSDKYPLDEEQRLDYTLGYSDGTYERIRAQGTLRRSQQS